MADKALIYAGVESGHLYRKEVGDNDWHELTGNGLPEDPQVRVIVPHPYEPEKVYIGTQNGVYFSNDRGDHWQRGDMPEEKIVWSIEFHPFKPDIMYCGTAFCEVYRSDDGAASWEYLSTVPTPDEIEIPQPTAILGLAIEPSHPDNIFAAMEVAGAAVSSDAGKTWKVVNRDLAPEVDLLDLHAVAIGSSRSDFAFISNRTGVWRTRDRGENWMNLHLERFSPLCYSRGVRVAPNNVNTIYACVAVDVFGSEGGVMRSRDLGATWQRFDHGIKPASTTFGVAINPQEPDQVYFCTRRGEVFGTQDAGATWQAHPLPGSHSAEFSFGGFSVACASA